MNSVIISFEERLPSPTHCQNWREINADFIPVEQNLRQLCMIDYFPLKFLLSTISSPLGDENA